MTEGRFKVNADRPVGSRRRSISRPRDAGCESPIVALWCQGSSKGLTVALGQGDPSGPKRNRWRYLPLALALVAAGAIFATGTHRYLSLESLIENRDKLQTFVAMHQSKALVLYILIYITAVTLSIPGAVFLTILGGFLFGWLVGGAAAAVSATIGAVGIFLIARTSVGDALLRRAGPRLQRLATGFQEDAFSYLLFLRFLPIVPFWVTNLASALFGVSLKTFFLATQIGLIPGTLAFAVAGSGLDSVIAAQQQAREACLAAGGSPCSLNLHPKHLLTPEIIAAFVALGILALAPIIVKRFARRRFKNLDGGEAGS
jgi:uncharacterized membrane protein YdjX (TVP38/TMEM64 family)